MKRTISILMIAMMILTSGAFTAFASVDGSNQTQEVGETKSEEGIGDVSTVAAYGGYGSVNVYWTPVSGAEKYWIYKSTSKTGKYTFVKTVYPGKYDSRFTYVKPATVNGYSNNIPFAGYKYRDANTGATTYYKVYAVKKIDGKDCVSKSSPASCSQRVEYIQYDFTLKTKKKLTSHDGKKKTYTFKKGTTLRATGFGGGKYKFYYKINGKNYYFYCNAISAKNAKAIYKSTKYGNYSRLTAQNYVNEWGYSSKTKYMIWASFYTQHVYIFKGSKGNWICIRDFECGSGTAKAASPSGSDKYLISGPGTEKKPGKKYSRKGHGRRYYWSPYSSWNSFHSVKMSKAGKPLQTLGYPASKGCIRVPLEDAKFIFELPRNTRVTAM